MKTSRFSIHRMGGWMFGIEFESYYKDITLWVGKYGLNVRYGR